MRLSAHMRRVVRRVRSQTLQLDARRPSYLVRAVTRHLSLCPLARGHDLRLLLCHVCVSTARGPATGHPLVLAQPQRPRLQSRAGDDSAARVSAHTPLLDERGSLRLHHCAPPLAAHQARATLSRLVSHFALQHVTVGRNPLRRALHRAPLAARGFARSPRTEPHTHLVSKLCEDVGARSRLAAGSQIVLARRRAAESTGRARKPQRQRQCQQPQSKQCSSATRYPKSVSV